MSYSLLLSESSPGDLSLDAACSQLNQRLSSGDPDSWNEVFDLLYPVAFQSARVILSGKFGSECEDVAMETLAEILNQAVNVASAQGLKPLAAAIARNKSKDLLRRRLAEKRGGNKIESLDLMIESSGERAVALPQADFLDALTTGELRELLTELSEELKKEYRLILKDHFLISFLTPRSRPRERSLWVLSENTCSVGFHACVTLSHASQSFKTNFVRCLRISERSTFCCLW